jgi:hypothetical protein
MTTDQESRTRLPDESAATLWKSEGFAVEAPQGRVGLVEDAVRIPGLKRPAALAVRTNGRHVVLVPITEIVEVDADAQTIRIREAPHSER